MLSTKHSSSTRDPHVTHRYPGPVTQLHPQHKRLLNQKQRAFPRWARGLCQRPSCPSSGTFKGPSRLSRKAEGWDPYCSLMTAKEKEWITRLQMIQLQSERPYLEDYYYQVGPASTPHVQTLRSHR